MAMPMSSTFTMPDRRKRVVTYGKSTRLPASQKAQEDASSPERPRKLVEKQAATGGRAAGNLETGGMLGGTKTHHQKPPASFDIFDVPSDDEPTPRPSAAPKRTMPAKKHMVDDFDIPSSGDERPQPIRRPMQSSQPVRKAEPAKPLVYASKKKVQDHTQVAVPSSSDIPTSSQPSTVRRRAKTPQAVQKPPSVEQPQAAKRTTVKPSTRSRATTPAAPASVAQKSTKTTTVPNKKSTAKPATTSSVPDIFDFPSSDEDAPSKTPVRPRLAFSSRPKPPPAVPKLHVPPSPALSTDSDASNASHKRKRGASVSSSTTVKATDPPGKKRESSVPQRSKKYQKKEDSISPGHNASTFQSAASLLLNKSEEPGPHMKQRRVRSNPSISRPPIAKGQSSPATLHSMLAVRSISKPSPIPEIPEAPVMEDETMYDIPEVTTPQVRAIKNSMPGSVTPRQEALFNNLLGDSSDSATPMPSISRLQLTSRPPSGAIAALARSSSDIPQSAHTRRGRLLDMLKKAAASSDENSESDEETEEDITSIPVVSAPSKNVVKESPTANIELEAMDVDPDKPVNSQTSQVAVHLHSGSKRTYAQQRSYLEEANLEDGLLMDLDDDLGFGAEKKREVSEDLEDSAQVRGIHELRRQGQQYKFQAEAQAAIDDIAGKGLNSSQRRSAMMDFAIRMTDENYIVQLLESALTSSLLRSISSTGEIIFDFSAAVAVLLILESRPGYAVIDQIYQSSILETVNRLLTSNFSGLDVQRIAKDRKTNMAPSTRGTVDEFRTIILKSSVWDQEKPEKVTPQLMALKVLELLAIGLRKAGNTDAIVDEGVVTKLLNAASGPCQRLDTDKATTQDHIILDMTFSILEALSVSSESKATWSNEMLTRLVDMMPVFFKTTNSSPVRLVIRLCMNLTNNKPKACQVFARPSFVLPLLRSIRDNFKQLSTELEETRRNETMEDVILSLGAMINLAEYSDQARASVIQDGDELIYELAQIFLEGSERADQADSMEESQSSVIIGYLTVLLGNLCLNDMVRSKVRSRLPNKKIDMLVQKVKEFVLYNQRVDRLTGQFEGEEGRETLKNFTTRLLLVVERLEKAGA